MKTKRRLNGGSADVESLKYTLCQRNEQMQIRAETIKQHKKKKK